MPVFMYGCVPASVNLLARLWIGGDCLGGVDACQILANSLHV